MKPATGAPSRKGAWVLALALACGVAACGPVADRNERSSEELAHELVVLLKFDQQLLNGYARCTSIPKTLTLEALTRSDPDRLYGLTPGSPQWPRALEVYKEYHLAACQGLKSEKLLPQIEYFFSKQLPHSELVAAVNFYSSDAGSKLTGTIVLAGDELSRLMAQESADRTVVAADEFHRRLKQLALGK